MTMSILIAQLTILNNFLSCQTVNDFIAVRSRHQQMNLTTASNGDLKALYYRYTAQLVHLTNTQTMLYRNFNGIVGVFKAAINMQKEFKL